MKTRSQVLMEELGLAGEGKKEREGEGSTAVVARQ